MTMGPARLFLVFLLCVGGVASSTPGAVAAPEKGADKHAPPGVFSTWSAETFARAKRERRILVLMVSTSWCHWCHVMKRATYGDARVQRALKAHFLPVLTDADHRPDLAERFRHYRWPTTAFLTPDAKPILALRGHRGPAKFLGILADVRRRVKAGGPYPGFDEPAKRVGVAYATDRAGFLKIRAQIKQVLDRYYDPQRAGWGRKQKYPVPDPVEYGLRRRLIQRAPSADFQKSMATLQAMEPLLDRQWGGVYQYSLESRWDRWHPEKIMSVNAGALNTYALAYAIDQNPRWRKNAENVVRWLTRFMRAPGGGFYGTQDADAPRMPGEQFYRLKAIERMPYGVPPVNRKLYAKDNAEAVLGLVGLYVATGNAELLTLAKGAMTRILSAKDPKAHWIRHQLDGTATAPIYLVDHALVGRALLALDQSAPEPTSRWFRAAKQVAEAMHANFADAKTGGYFDVARDTAGVGVFAERIRSLEPNAAAARFLLSLAARAEDPTYDGQARRAISAVSTSRTITQHWRHGAGLLMAVEQALASYAHIKVVGDRRTKAGAAALKAVRQLAQSHPYITWAYETSATDAKPTFYVCGRDTCSDPITAPAKLRPFVEQLLR